MIIITNKQRGPVQLIVRSRMAPRSFTVKNVPGVGAGKNVYHMPDELYSEHGNIDRLENAKLISVKRVPDNSSKGE